MSAPARISVVVPVLEEAEEIRGFLDRMRAGGPHEIIVADGGSSDGTIELAREGADRVIVEPGGLALQLNRGAAAATGDVLLFPYADTRLPDGWPEAIDRVLTRSGVAGGAFRFRLAGSGLRYRLIEWGTRLRARVGIGPFGDQALFTTRELFQEVGGFRPGALLEDLDLVRRLRRRGRVVILPEAVETSARRWERAGFLSTTLGNLAFLGLHVLGRRGEGLTAAYRRYRLRGHAPE